MTAPVYSTILCPIEVVKLRLQVQSAGGVLLHAQRTTYLSSGNSSPDLWWDTGTEKLYRGPIDCVRKILRMEGLRGFFAGLAPTIGTRLVGSPVYFGTYEASKSFLHSGGDSPVRRWPLT